MRRRPAALLAVSAVLVTWRWWRSEIVAVPSYPRLPRGRVHGWADEGVGVPARYVDALHRAGAQEALFLPTAWTSDDAAALLQRVDGLLLELREGK